MFHTERLDQSTEAFEPETLHHSINGPQELNPGHSGLSPFINRIEAAVCNNQLAFQLVL